VFGGFVFVVVFFGAMSVTSRVWVWSVFLMPVFGVFLLGQIVLIRILLVPVGARSFCLESLILAQDER
jgi:hypothetical protein